MIGKQNSNGDFSVVLVEGKVMKLSARMFCQKKALGFLT